MKPVYVTASRWWRFEPEGDFLRARLWKIVSATVAGATPPGTAMARAKTREIIFRDKAFLDSTVRQREYVMLHEIAHALHYEVMHYDAKELSAARDLDWDDTVECVADAYCYRHPERRTSMTAWVQTSVRWHKLNTAADYSMSDVRCAEAREVAAELRRAVGGS